MDATVLTGATLTRWPEADAVVDVAIGGGRIVAVAASLPVRAGDRRVDLAGLRIAPGYVDLQVNGGHGHDITTDPDSMWDVAAELPRHGVTSFLPTVVTSRPDTVERALQAVRHAGAARPGARILGLHLEGPFISIDRRGTHPAEHVAPPVEADVGRWSITSGVRMVTLAPELAGAGELVGRLTEQGVVVAAGHSAATYEEMGVAVDAGLRAVTHLFNGMSPFEHRNPGIVGRALTDPRLVASLIVDGHHLHPATVAIAFGLLGVERTVLVSDATAAVGRPPGRYRLGDVTITLAADHVLRNDDGVLAGSVLTLDRAVRNLRDATGCSAAAAVATATSSPASLLDERSLGTVAPGAHADLVVLDDRLEVCATIIAGEVVHDPEGRLAGSMERRAGATGEPTGATTERATESATGRTTEDAPWRS